MGAHPLPLRADGFGQVLPTPKELRVRRFPTEDLLPPPADGAFHSSIGPVTGEIRRRMGKTWSPACPVALHELRYVTVTFRGFDGQAHTGELVLAARAARDVVSVFRALFRADFPIEEMRLPTTADIEAHPTGDGNNTAALVCRASRGTTTWSAHAYGLAVDINPFLNPYSKGDLVLPELASAYLDRSRRQPGIIHADSVAVREFARIGWSWGGAWQSLKDYQHFTATGR
ncbi:M15 family metallopeptidase [Nocardioides sp.]|nr:M15 family metallopeptidase [Nocardioides sp.]